MKARSMVTDMELEPVSVATLCVLSTTSLFRGERAMGPSSLFHYEDEHFSSLGDWGAQRMSAGIRIQVLAQSPTRTLWGSSKGLGASGLAPSGLQEKSFPMEAPTWGKRLPTPRLEQGPHASVSELPPCPAGLWWSAQPTLLLQQLQQQAEKEWVLATPWQFW